MIESHGGVYYLLVPKRKAQRARQCIGDLHVKGMAFISATDDRLGVPFRGNPEEVSRLVAEDLEMQMPEVKPCDHESLKLSRRTSKSERVDDICKSFLTSVGREDLSSEIPKHWELHGDIALLGQGCFVADVWKTTPIPDAGPRNETVCFFDRLCTELNVKKLAKKSTIRDDDYRSPKVELLYGFIPGNNEDTWARRVENGIVYSWDITRSMFSVGNITEKMRVAEFDCRGKTVVDLFAGIGYFTLPYLRHAEADHVYACEWNPAAIEALQRNIAFNNIDPTRCTILPGDNRQTCPGNVADIVNLGLIPSSAMSYQVAVEALRRETGGVLLIHGNVRTERDPGDIAPNNDAVTFSCDIANPSWKKWVTETCQQIEELLDASRRWNLTVMHLERVKQFSPHVDHMVLDLKVEPDEPTK